MVLAFITIFRNCYWDNIQNYVAIFNLYNILWNRIYKNFLEIISRKIREYFLDLLFERKNDNLL